MAQIHPSAVVDRRAQLADDAAVGPFCILGPDVELGPGVELRAHVHVTGRTTIGARTRVFPFVVLGEEPQDKSWSGEATALSIGADNVIREHTSIHVGTSRGGGCTRIGDDNLIMNGAHIGHDAQIGSHIIVASHVAIAGHAVVEDYAVIGGLSGVHQYARIGESAMVAALSGVTLDAPPFALVAGERATLRGLNVVGLKRRGVTAEVREELKRAFHILFFSKLRLAPALERVRAAGFKSDEAARLVAFFELSERGVSR
ncbi:MAG TPA: acyl-ACP--UDP-N-acetylglucosamine O-acyltransferase [Myxococcota bacterium]